MSINGKGGACVVRELSLAEIFQLGYYWETKILLTAVKLDIFSALRDQPRTALELAESLQLDDSALRLLLHALVAMRVLRKEGDRFSNTSVGQQYLVRTSPDYVGHLLILHDAEWANWGRLEDAIRTGKSPATQHVFATNPELGAQVLAVLDRIGQASGPHLAKRLKLSGITRMLDVGGGAATNAIAFCREYPELEVTVLDLPATLGLAKEAVRRAGLTERIHLLPGDFLTDSFQGRYEMIFMSDILHYQAPPTNAWLVRKAYDHLESGGRLVVKDRFLDPSRTSPAWTTAFAVHILVNTEHGQCVTSEEVQEWMRQAGFTAVEELEPCAVVQGLKPSKPEGQDHG
ncbi:MAG: methyltransferase domain-containing protein [Nitrospirae bacterium]|nr:MAG: methyltransferase domain-containing protein [Nitrospirota bacterium]